MPYIPHTQEDIDGMLQEIGAKDIDQLFSEIPKELQTDLHDKVDKGLNELEVSKLLRKFADKDYGIANYIGAGAYEHHIPAAVWDITSRGEYMTAYTPYQAEASQGNLQLIYEYQTMMSNLTGMDVSNASLYDGASAVAESVLMSIRCNKKNKSRNVLLLGSLHPNYIDTVRTIVSHQGFELVVSDIDKQTGTFSNSLMQKYQSEDFVSVVISQPNFFGQLEDVHAVTNWAHSKQAFVVAAVNPISLAIFTPPSEWGDSGADIVCGEGQPLGVPLASGGPYFGFQCCRIGYVRQMPGRIVGRTQDQDGKQGFTLTLQAREQHIRRSKATSNICTNQGLLVTAATIHMSLLGSEGLERVATQCWHNTQYLINKFSKIPGVRKLFQGDHFHEVVFQFEKPLEPILAKLNQHKIAGGLNLSDASLALSLDNCLLVCVTETKDTSDIDNYAEVLTSILKEVA